MKYKLFGLSAVVLLLICASLVHAVEPDRNRYHQHLEAAEKAPCTDHKDELFCTHLPLMNITTDAPIPDPYLYDEDGEILLDEKDSPLKNEEMVAASVQYFDQKQANNHLTDTPSVNARATVRVRGNSSRTHDKPGYLLKFKTDDLSNGLKVSLSGMTADSDWVLHGPFLDKSLIRNYICYNLSGEIMEYAPNVRFCELILNGEYMGIYLIIERIGYLNDGRVNIAKSDADLTSTSYILRVDRGASSTTHSLQTFANFAYLTATPMHHQQQLEIIYPGAALTEQQYQFIQKDFSKFEKSLYSFDYSDPKMGYAKYIDADSFVDYFLINEFTLNYDAVNVSTYLYKDIGGRLKICVWDFNSAFDYYTDSFLSQQTFQLSNRLWYLYLFKDEAFVDRVIDRYQQLRKSFLNEEYLFDYIDSVVEYLGPAIDRNFEKWGYSFDTEYDLLTPTDRNVRSHEEAITQIKETISARISYMDSNIDRLYSLCHESVNKKFNHDKEGQFG